VVWVMQGLLFSPLQSLDSQTQQVPESPLVTKGALYVYRINRQFPSSRAMPEAGAIMLIFV
jgi:hypothetical protein